MVLRVKYIHHKYNEHHGGFVYVELLEKNRIQLWKEKNTIKSEGNTIVGYMLLDRFNSR